MENKEEMLKIERSIGYILRIGVIVSATIILIGMILLFFQPATGQAPLNSLTLIMHELVQLNGEAFVMLGLFCLILTPVLRVWYQSLHLRRKRIICMFSLRSLC